MEKRYVVVLTAGERQQLEEVLRRGRQSRFRQTRARLFLKADEGAGGPVWTDAKLCEAFDLSPSTVLRARKQLVEEVAAPIPSAPGRVLRHDYEYRRNGVVNLFLAFEPLRGWRWVEVTERRTRKDWAHTIAQLLERHYSEAECLLLVLDNLNTHSGASFYEAFAPDRTQELLGRLHFVHTPKHGSWLNLAEAEFSILQRQCLNPRIPEIPALELETHTWFHQCNQLQVGADWLFTTQDARIKLKRLYPSFED